MADNEKLDVYLQLEYLEDLRSTHPSARLEENIRLVEQALFARLRRLGVEDIEAFKRECHEAQANREHHHEARHLENA